MTIPIGTSIRPAIAQVPGAAPQLPGSASTDEPSFGDTLKRVVEEASTAQDTAQDAIARYAAGEPVELHQVMAAQEESAIALELLVQVRNKVTEAYHTLVNMQS